MNIRLMCELLFVSTLVSAGCSFSQYHSPLVDTLRSEMRYKFALDALVYRRIEVQTEGERFLQSAGEELNNFVIADPSEDTLALEQFRYFGKLYSLYRIP